MAVKIFKVKDSEFEEYIPKPLITGDVGAYKIVVETNYDLDGHRVKITAKRADGAVFDDIGIISGKNAEYVIKSDIYAVEGETEIRVVIISPEGNRLTDKALIFEVLSGHETGDMLKPSDGGKSIADLAVIHIYDDQNPHNVTAEQLGLGMVTEGWESKLDFVVCDRLPSLQSAKENTLYFVYKINSDWSIDNIDAIRYDLYIKTPNMDDPGAGAWTRLSEGERDSVPTQNSGNTVTSGGVYSAIYNEAVDLAREITRVENIVCSESEQFSDLISGLYFYEKTIKLSECASESYGWHTLAEEVPENVLFFVENDTDTAISEFREYDSAAIKLGTPIDAGETRLCVLTRRETVSIDSNKDGYIFVLDEGALSKAATEVLAEKQDKVTGGASTIVSSNLTANRAVVSNSSGKVSASAVTSTELGCLDGVTSNVQAQLDSKAPKSHASTATTYGTGTASSYGHVKLSSSVTSTSSTDSAVAATPYAVKQAYDLANTANTRANDAYDLADDAYFSLYTNGYAGGSEVTADLSELCNAFYSGDFAGAAEVVDTVTDLSHAASDEEYFTGKLWLDGSPIYRRDFCVVVNNTSEQYTNGAVYFADIYSDVQDVTIISAQAFGSLGTTDYYYTGNTDCHPVTFDNSGVYFDEIRGGTGFTHILIYGWIEYRKSIYAGETIQKIFE